MPFLTTALGVGAIAGGVGGGIASIVGAGEQAGAAKTAAQLQAQEAAASLAFQRQVYEENVARAAPWVRAGTGAINTLAGLVSTPGQGLLTPWTTPFNAPVLSETTDPGYAARLQLGEQSLERSAAARGGVLAGGTARDIVDYAQTFASNEYQNVFSRALTQYQQAYNIFQQNQANLYNRLAGVAGTGQTSTAQLGAAGESAARNVADINLTTGANIGRDIQAAAYQTASGYAGAVNAFGGIPTQLGGIYALQQLLNQQQTPFYGTPQQSPGQVGAAVG